jgi:serine phosphatase RsbU (regulator of sigma subunit)
MADLQGTGASKSADERDLASELRTVYAELNLLYTLSAGLGRLTSEVDIAAVALREAITVARAGCGWFVTWDGTEAVIPHPARTGITSETAASIARAVLDPNRGPAAGHVIVHDLEAEFALVDQDAPERLLACAIGSGRNTSWLCLGRGAGSLIFTSAEQKLLTTVAAFTRIAFENVRLHNEQLERDRLVHELEMARSIQRSLLPREFRCFPWLDAAGESIPCYEIGGDYFDVIRLGGDECLFVIADVSGKGPAAALRAATVQGNVQALCHSQLFSNPLNLTDLLQTVNEAFLSRTSEAAGFVTACLAVLDGTGRFRYSNAGHDSPLWIPASGPVAKFPGGGPLVGVLPGASFPEGSAMLAPGDLVLFYTDGVTDCENEQGDRFDSERLRAWAERQAGRSPDAVREDLIRELKTFCGSRRHPDDLTFLVVKYCGH